MAFDYFKEDRLPRMPTYTAVGPEFEQKGFGGEVEKRRPYASVSVMHTPSQYVVPYPNNEKHNSRDPEGVTGLGSNYLQHLSETIQSKPEDDWTGNDDSAMQVLKTLRNMDHRLDGGEDSLIGHAFSPRDVNLGFVKAGMKSNPHFQPETLFERVPSSIQIDNMMADPSMGHAAITLAALAKRDLGAEKVIASNDLSYYSSKLTKTALKKGLVETDPSNPDADQTNYMRQHNRSVDSASANNVWNNDEPDTPVSPDLVRAARQDVREMLRKPKARNTTPVTKKGLSDQFLPGMEGFV
jgi:hypothetical protein